MFVKILMDWNVLNSGDVQVIQIQSTNLANLLVAFSGDASKVPTYLFMVFMVVMVYFAILLLVFRHMQGCSCL